MPLDAATLDTLGGELRALVGDRLSTAQAVRKHHSAGETWHPAHIPDIVVFARSTDEVAAIVKICARHKAPIIAKTDNDQSPVLTVAVAGDRPLRELTELADKVVKVQLERSYGVGEVRLIGGLNRGKSGLQLQSASQIAAGMFQYDARNVWLNGGSRRTK